MIKRNFHIALKVGLILSMFFFAGGMKKLWAQCPTLDATNDVVVTNVSCNGFSDGEIDITVTPNGYSGGYQYTLFGTPPVGPPIIRIVTSTSPTQVFSNLPRAVYLVTITPEAPCFNLAFSVTITEPPLLEAMTGSKTDVLGCNGDATGEIDVAPTGGVLPYEYSLNGGPFQSSSLFTNLTAGSYSITVQDANGCTSSYNETITEPDPLVINSVSATNVTCNGFNDGLIEFTSVTGGTPAYEYSVDGGVNYVATSTISGLSPGTYDILVRDANGCLSNPSQVIISEPALLMLSLAGTDPACAGDATGEITATASGGTGVLEYSIDGVNFQAGNSFLNLTAGSYSITVRDANGCTATENIALTDPPAINVSLAGTDPACAGDATGEITVTASGGTGTLEYSLDGTNFQAATTFTGLTAGAYTITVRDANGCTITNNITLTDPPAINVSLAGTDPACTGEATGEITVTASGGTGTLEYSLDGTTFQAGNTFTGLSAGAYTITVRDANGCTTTDNITLTDPPAITVSLAGTDPACTGEATGEITVTASGGTGTLEYSLDGVTFQAGNTFTGLSASAYTITVRDANGCTTTDNITLTDPPAISVSLAGTDPVCAGDATGEITVTASGGTGTLEYSLDGTTFQAGNTFTGLPAGAYTITVRDANGCTTTDNITLTDPPAITVSLAGTDPACTGEATGEITVTASGGTGTLEYSLDGTTFQAGNTFTGLPAGAYTITVRDANGCTATDNITLTDPPAITVSLAGTDPACTGEATGEITVTASGGAGTLEYSLDGTNFQAGNTFTGLPAGAYIVTVRDANGCTATDNITLTDPPAITVSLAGTDPACTGEATGEITVTASGGTGTLEYSLDGSTFQTGNTFTGLTAGAYTITVRDANGCTTTDNITLTDPPAITVSLAGTDPACNGEATGEITVAASGGTGTLEYSLDGVTFQAGNTFTGLAAGAYTVTVRDANGCTVTDNITLTDPPAITVSLAGTDPACTGEATGEITVTASGGTGTLEYSLDGTTFQAGNTFTGLTAGAYTVTVRDANGCTVTDNITLTDPPAITVSLAGTDPACTGEATGEITVTASGGTGTLEYSLDGSTFQTGNTFTGLSAGAYTMTVRDANGCTTTDNITLTDPPAITVSLAGSDPLCTGDATGEITVTATGGTGTLEYSLDGITFQAGNSFTGLTAGAYTVTVRDANGCTATSSITLTDPAPLTVSLTGSDVTTCGGSDGSVTSAVSNGSGDYSYSWSGPSGFTAVTANISGLTAGTYTVIVTDNIAGCTATNSITINDPPSFTISTTVTDITCPGFDDGTLTVTVTGGVGPFSYSLDGMTYQASDQFTGLTDSTYTVRVQDTGSSCFDSVDVTIAEPPVISATLSTTPASCIGGADGAIAVLATGGTGTLEYSLDGSTFQASSDFTGLAAGSYTVTIRDANGCTTTANATISETGPATLILQQDAPGLCPGDDIDFTATPGYDTYTFRDGVGGPVLVPSSASNTATISGLVDGQIIEVEAVSAACGTFTAVDTVDINPALILTLSQSNPGGCLGASSTLTASPGFDSYAFRDGVGGPVLQSGTSNTLVSSTLTNGQLIEVEAVSATCGTLTATVTIDLIDCGTGCPTFTVSIDNLVRPTCTSNDDGEVSFAVSGGSGNYVFTLRSTTTTFSQALTGAGPFTFTDLSADEYEYEIDDGTSNCILPFSLVNETTVTLTLGNFESPDCFGEATGRAEVTSIAGGTFPYEYSLDGGVTWQAIPGDRIIKDLPALGVYPILVRDDATDLCPAEAFVDIPETATPIVATVSTTDASCANNDGELTIEAISGGSGTTYDFAVNGGAFTQASLPETVTGLASGEVSLSLRDELGCISVDTVTIGAPDQVIASIIPVNDPTCAGGGEDGTVIVRVNQAATQLAPPYEVAVSAINDISMASFTEIPINSANGEYEVTLDTLVNGTYFVWVRDLAQTGCTVLQSFTIANGPIPIAFALDSVRGAACLGDNGTAFFGDFEVDTNEPLVLEVTQSGGPTQTLTLQYVDVANGYELPGLPAGNYQVILRQTQGTCDLATAPVVFEIEEPDAALGFVVTDFGISFPERATGFITVEVQESGFDPYEIRIEALSSLLPGQDTISRPFVEVPFNPNTLSYTYTFEELWSADYEITIRDANGCVVSDVFFIDYDRELKIPNVFTPNNDGFNDVFFIRNLPDNSSLTVTNRWGKQVFESDNYQNNWDASNVEDGVYYYRLVSNSAGEFMGWVEVWSGGSP